MFGVNGSISVSGAAFLIAVGLSGCGSSHGGKPTTAARPSMTASAITATQPTAAQPVAVQSAGDRVAVAHVGGAVISKGMVDHWISLRKPKVASYEPKSRAECSSVRAPNEVTLPKGRPRPSLAQIKRLCEQQHQRALRESVLSSLISYEWVIREAAEDGVPVSDREVQQKFVEDKRIQFPSEAEFQKYLKSTGETVPDLLLGLRRELASENIRSVIKNSVGEVTPARIAAYYNAHKHRYLIPESRDIAAIRTWTKPVIERAKREVSAGVSFASVARRVSIELSTAEHGGVTLGVTPGQQEKGYDQAIFAAKLHVLTGPLNLRKRFYIFRVEKIHPPHQQSIAEVEAMLKQKLPPELEKQALVHFVKTWRKKWTARTNCNPGYIVRKCRQYKTSSGTPEEDPYTLN